MVLNLLLKTLLVQPLMILPMILFIDGGTKIIKRNRKRKEKRRERERERESCFFCLKDSHKDFSENGFSDGFPNKDDVFFVNGTGEMREDLMFGGDSIEFDETLGDELDGVLKVEASSVVGEAAGDVEGLDLGGEEVALVEEEEEGSGAEEGGVDDLVEQEEGFLHAVGDAVLGEDLVVLANGDAEEDGGDGVEAVDPFSARSAGRRRRRGGRALPRS